MSLEEVIGEFVVNYGMISVFLLVLLEYANFPLPSELVLPLMGIVGVVNGVSFIEILVISVIAGILGSILNYIIGLYFGPRVVDYITLKFPKTKKSADAAYSWINKYDNIAVLLSRLVPLARTFISIVAGVVKMRPIAFIGYSAIGITIWNSILIGLGFVFGNNSEVINLILKRYSLIVGVIIVLIAVVLIIKNKDKIKEKLF